MATGDQALMLALAQNAGQVDPSPWTGAGQAILQSQLPHATNNTEAILGPILQGLIGGGLTGYGQASTNKAAYDAFSQNPILQSLNASLPTSGPGSASDIGPVANGDLYGADLGISPYQGTMPANWTPKQGQADILSALLAKEKIDEEEQKKQALRDKIAEVSAGEMAKQGYPASTILDSISGKTTLDATGALPESPVMKALLDSYGITDPAVRAGLRTPDQADKYLLHVATQGEKADAKKAVQDTRLENTLRKELQKTNSPYTTALTVAPLLQAAENTVDLKDHTPQSDLALIDTYNKIINPGGVLRAELVKQTLDAQNPGNRIAGEIEKVFGGGQFNDTTRSQLMDVLRSLAKEKLSAGKAFVDNTLAIARNKNLDTSNLIDPGYYDQIFGSVNKEASSIPAGAVPTGKTSKGKPVYLVNGQPWVAD